MRSVHYEPWSSAAGSLATLALGTVLTIVESGFDRVPLARRAEAFRMNDGGWTEQARRCLDQISIQWDAAIDRLRAFVEETPE